MVYKLMHALIRVTGKVAVRGKPTCKGPSPALLCKVVQVISVEISCPLYIIVLHMHKDVTAQSQMIASARPVQEQPIQEALLS